MATREEIVEKVKRLVNDKFGGDADAAFRHYDADGDGRIGHAELVSLFKEASVGSWVTRSTIASRVIAAVDRDGDGLVAKQELFDLPEGV